MCSQVFKKQGKIITQPVSKCTLQKNPTENYNFSHKTAFLHIGTKSVIFNGFFLQLTLLYQRCVFFLLVRYEPREHLSCFMLSSSSSQMAKFKKIHFFEKTTLLLGQLKQEHGVKETAVSFLIGVFYCLSNLLKFLLYLIQKKSYSFFYIFGRFLFQRNFFGGHSTV